MVYQRFLQFARAQARIGAPRAKTPASAPAPRPGPKPGARNPAPPGRAVVTPPPPRAPTPVVTVPRGSGRLLVAGGAAGGLAALGLGGKSYLDQLGAAALVREQETGNTQRDLGRDVIDKYGADDARALLGDLFQPAGGENPGSILAEEGTKVLLVLGLAAIAVFGLPHVAKALGGK